MNSDSSVGNISNDQPFVLLDDGLYTNVLGKQVKVSSPISALGKSVNSDGSGPAYVLRAKLLMGGTRRLEIPVSVLSQPSRFDEHLSNAGVQIERGMRRQLIEYVQKECPAKLFLRTASEGWIELTKERLVYVLGKKLIGTERANIGLLLQDGVRSKFSTSGELDSWIEIMDLCKSNPIIVYAMCAALSSALLFPLGHDSGFVALAGKSSTGKSTLLRLINSTFSNPDQLFTWEGTDNGIEALVALHKDVPMSLDEITKQNADLVGKVIYRLANSSSKARATSSGTLAPTGRTRTVIFTSGEESAVDLLRAAGGAVKLGQLARFITIPVGEKFGVFSEIHQAACPADFARYLDRRIRKTYGVAWPAYIEYIAELGTDLPHEYENVRDRIISRLVLGDESLRDDGIVARVVEKFAISVFAGFCAIGSKIVNWDRKEVVSSVRHAFHLWHAEYAKNKAAGNSDFLSDLRHWLCVNIHSVPEFHRYRYLDKKNSIGYTAQLQESSEAVILIFPQSLLKQFEGKMTKLEINRALQASGYLVSTGNRCTKQIRVPGMAEQRLTFYMLRRSVLDGE